MALPDFPATPTVGQLFTANSITWRCRAVNPVYWEPLAFNTQNYFVSPEMFGAVGNGSTDDTQALAAAFAAANKVIVLRPGATYLVTGRLNLANKQDLELLGNGARILRNQTDGMYPGQATNPNTGYVNPGVDQHILVLLSCKNVKVTGLRIRGGYNPASPQTPGINTTYWSNSQTNGRGEDGHGISIVQSEDILVENCEIVNVWGDAFWVTSGGYLGTGAIANKNITIRSNDIRNPFRGCVSSVHHTGLRFTDNYCEKFTGYTTAVLLEPNNNVAQNCISTFITGNTISCGPSGVVAATSAGALLNGDFIRDLVIASNVVSGAVFVSLTSPNTTGVVIDGNSYYNSGLVANSAQFGLFLEANSARDVKAVSNLDYSGGTSDAYYRGVRLDSCSNVSFEKHTIRPQDAKTNVEYFQVISTNFFRLLDSLINGRDTVDPSGTPIVSMYGSSSFCRVEGNYFNGTGTTQGVVYLEQASYTGTGNIVQNNVITSAAGNNAIALKTNHFGTAVGYNNYTSGRVSNVSGGTAQCYQHPSTNFAAQTHVYGTAAPTTGTWALGSRVINTGTGPTDYWECTTAGSPGTWTVRN